AGPDLGKRWPCRLVATAAEDCLNFRRNPRTSFAAASDCRTCSGSPAQETPIALPSARPVPPPRQRDRHVGRLMPPGGWRSRSRSRFVSAASAVLCDQLETDDTGEDQANTYQPQRRRRLCEQVDAPATS